LGQNNHCTVHVKKTGDLEKDGTSSFQDLAEQVKHPPGLAGGFGS
jgi:hypothetical protein